jgi:hypothetical protein
MISRSLYIILEDQRLKDTDPLEALPDQLFRHAQSRMSNATLLTRESACLLGVPSHTVDRFLELMAMYDIPEGKRSSMRSLCMIWLMQAIHSMSIFDPPSIHEVY